MKKHLVCLALLTAGVAQAQPTLNLDTRQITVSGLSAGGYMANQFHVAYSDWVSGAAIISAGPYYCAQNDITVALDTCVDALDGSLAPASLLSQAEKWAKAGKIAPLENLQDDRVWLLHGTRDQRVAQEVTDLLHQQYQTWLSAEAVRYIVDKPFGHHFPTLQDGGACSASDTPFIGDCNYDAAGEALGFLLGELNAPDDTQEGEVISYNQHDIAGAAADTLAQTGYAYVPKSCADGQPCQVHVSFHGCNQYADAVNMAYVERTGLNRWADDNQLVVFYPQTRKSLFMPLNPQGCWDWWGYTGDDYATRDGEQLRAVKAIIDAFTNSNNVKDDA